MNYNLTCPHCGKRARHNTRDATVLRRGDAVEACFDCAECGEEIVTVPAYPPRRAA